MKAIAFVPAVVAAVLAFNVSSASSQQACQKEFLACMDSCATRSSKTIQDSCFQGCEGKNNFCAERVYGKRPFNGAPSNVADQKGQAKDALAKKQKTEDAAPEPEANAKEQAAEDRAPQQPAPEAAPQSRRPAER